MTWCEGTLGNGLSNWKGKPWLIILVCWLPGWGTQLCTEGGGAWPWYMIAWPASMIHTKLGLQFFCLKVILTFIPLVEGNVRATECNLAHLHQQFISLGSGDWDIFISVAGSWLVLYQSFHCGRQHFQAWIKYDCFADINSHVHLISITVELHDHAPFILCWASMNMEWWSGVTVLMGCMLLPAATLPLLKYDDVNVDTVLSQDEKCTLCIVSPSELSIFCLYAFISHDQLIYMDVGCH